MMFTPRPKFTPRRLPRRVPKVIVPSYIGESGQTGNWLFYNGPGVSSTTSQGRATTGT